MIPSTLFAEDKTLFIPFLMAGHPTQKATLEALFVLENAGADLIELGVPFTDPVADGPINQRAAEYAIQNGITLEKVLGMVEDFHEQGGKTPLILFSYFNPIFKFGLKNFAQRARQAALSAVLVVDLPHEEADELHEALAVQGIPMVFLASPTTTPVRLQALSKYNPLFIYYVSRLGVTGAATQLSSGLKNEVGSIQKALSVPVCVGFGISSSKQAGEVARFADGVIVGSTLVKTLEESYFTSGIVPFQEKAKQFSQAIHLMN